MLKLIRTMDDVPHDFIQDNMVDVTKYKMYAGIREDRLNELPLKVDAINKQSSKLLVDMLNGKKKMFFAYVELGAVEQAPQCVEQKGVFDYESTRK